MTFREELTDLVYRFVLTSVIAVFLFLEIYNFYDPELITKGNIISLLLISLSFNVLIILYHKIHLYIFPAIFLVITVFSFIIDAEDAEMILNSTLFKLVLIGLGSFILFLISDMTVRINLILSAGIIAYLLISLFRGTSIHPVTPAPGLFYVAFSITRFFRKGLKETDKARVRTYIAYLYPFLAVILISLIIVPKPESPISWDWAKRLYDYAVDKINEIGHELSIKFSSSEGTDSLSINFGMNDEMIYDNNNITDDIIMEITPNRQVGEGIYLNGEYFNEFSGGQWRNTLKSDKDYSCFDALESTYGIINFTPEAKNGLVKTATLKIRYIDFATSILFTPAKQTASIDRSIKKELNYRNEHILFNTVKTYGTEYSVNYLQLNYGSRVFNEYMKTVLTDKESAFNYVKSNDLYNLYNEVTLDDLKEYRNYINASYSSKPEIRDSVKNYIEKIVSGSNTDYEKLKAVESALSGMEYRLEGGQLPDYVDSEGDFLNYFLLEKRSGYCVHYATAFCLIARYLGYKSRVVQGFLAPPKSDPTVSVPASSGHTWAEVYFENKGWIAFEPTPGFGIKRYSGWKVMSGPFNDYEGYDFTYTPPIPTEIPVPVEDPEYELEHTESRVSWLLILIIAAIIVISIILLVTVNIIRSHLKQKKMTKKELYIFEFNKVLHILEEFKLTREKQETIEEFSRRCSVNISDIICKINLKKYFEGISDMHFMSTYESVIYGNSDPDEQDRKELSDRKNLFIKLMKKHFRRTYLIHRLHLMISM
ncbi:MAG: transglutaminase domain-containing protein [Lachnospiraceae bacterium]|nr:transglutaminase domain-containing protein [Lachnospiraceae bacterium]